MLNEAFVTPGMLKIDYVRAIRDIYNLHKGIAHGEISNIKGQDIDKWQEIAQRFLSEMTKIIDNIIEKRK